VSLTLKTTSTHDVIFLLPDLPSVGATVTFSNKNSVRH
jgi:hypothetical protein